MRTSLKARRGLLAVILAAPLGFGVTQAAAAPAAASAQSNSCPYSANGPYFYPPCEEACPGGFGYCDGNGFCACEM